MKKILTFLAAIAAIAAIAGGGPSTRVIGNGSFTNDLVVSTIPLKLYTLSGYNSTATNEFLMIFETNSLPANGTFPRMGPFPIGPNQFYSVDFSYYGADLDKCLVAMSTTSNTFTLAGTNFTFQAVIGSQTQ